MMKVNATRQIDATRKKCVHWMLGAASAALLVAGCASDDGVSKSQRLDAYLHAPGFLTSPASVLLTNAASYSAKVEIVDQGSSKTGVLLGRDNRLIFAQDPPKGSKKKHRYEQSSFIWDVSDKKGFVLSDPLQGFAPIAGAAKTEGSIETANTGASENIDGHHCRRVTKTVSLADGTKASYTVWEANDLKGLPIRIKSTTGFVINLSKVRFEDIATEVFVIPEGFQKYSSSDAMTSELLERELRMKNKLPGEWNRTPAEFDRGGINRNPYGPQ